MTWIETQYSRDLQRQKNRDFLAEQAKHGPAFRLDDGRVLFVHDGISSGRAWGTFYLAPTGSLRRFRGLPMCPTKDEAIRDLAAYAAANGLARFWPEGGND